MNLLLDIHQVHPGQYAYSIRTDGPGEGGTDPSECAFDSLETCLRDAGDSLGHYFLRVHMRYEGRVLGACATESLRRHPEHLAQRFMAAVGHMEAAAAMPA